MWCHHRCQFFLTGCHGSHYLSARAGVCGLAPCPSLSLSIGFPEQHSDVQPKQHTHIHTSVYICIIIYIYCYIYIHYVVYNYVYIHIYIHTITIIYILFICIYVYWLDPIKSPWNPHQYPIISSHIPIIWRRWWCCCPGFPEPCHDYCLETTMGTPKTEGVHVCWLMNHTLGPRPLYCYIRSHLPTNIVTIPINMPKVKSYEWIPQQLVHSHIHA